MIKSVHKLGFVIHTQVSSPPNYSLNMYTLSSPWLRLLDSLVVQCWLWVREFPGSIPSHRLLDSLVVQCWLRVREVPGSIPSHRLLDSLVVQCWLRVQEVPGSIHSQGRRNTKDIIKWYQQCPCLALNIQKGKYWLFLKN